MKNVIISLAYGLVVLACMISIIYSFPIPAAEAKSNHKADAMRIVNDYIGEGQCYLEQTYGPQVAFSTTVEYASQDDRMILTKSVASNQKGHLMDIFIMSRCTGKCVSDYVAVVMDSAAKQREIPTKPSKSCEGF